MIDGPFSCGRIRLFFQAAFLFLLRLQKLGEAKMRPVLWVLAASVALIGAASAQDVNLTGRYRCVQGCVAQEGDFATATQHGWDLDLVNEAGVSAKAWIDRAGHILVGSLARGREIFARRDDHPIRRWRRLAEVRPGNRTAAGAQTATEGRGAVTPRRQRDRRSHSNLS
jgi:hypothetical protein